MKFGKRILGLSASAALMLSLSAVLPVFATTTTPETSTEQTTTTAETTTETSTEQTTTTAETTTETPAEPSANSVDWTGAAVYGSPTGSRYNSTEGFPATNAAGGGEGVTVKSNLSAAGVAKVPANAFTAADTDILTEDKWTLSGKTDLEGVKIEVKSASAVATGTDAAPYTYDIIGKVDLEQGGGRPDNSWKNWVDIYFTGEEVAAAEVVATTNTSTPANLLSNATTVALNGTPVTVKESLFYWIGESSGTYTALGFDFDAAVNSSNGSKTFTVEIDPDGPTGKYVKRTFKFDYSGLELIKPNPVGEVVDVYVAPGADAATIATALTSAENYSRVPTGLNPTNLTEALIEASMNAYVGNQPTAAQTETPLALETMGITPVELKLAGVKKDRSASPVEDWCGQSHAILVLPAKDDYQLVNDITINLIPTGVGKLAETNPVVQWVDVGNRYMKETDSAGKLVVDGVEYVKGNGTDMAVKVTPADPNDTTKGYTFAVTGDVDLEAPGGNIANGWGNSVTLKVAFDEDIFNGFTVTRGVKEGTNNNGYFYFTEKALFLNMNPGSTKSYSTVVTFSGTATVAGRSVPEVIEIPITIDLSGVNCIQAGGGEGNISIPVGKTDAEIREMMRDPKNYTNLPVGLDVANLTDAVIDAAASQAGAPIPTIIEEGKEYSIKLAATKPSEKTEENAEKHPILMLPSLQNYQVVNDVTINVGLQVKPKPAEKQDPSVIVMNNINAGWKPAQAKNTILTTANNFSHDGISDFTDATVSEIYLYRGDLSAIKSVDDFRKIATTDLTVITDNDVMMENRTYVAVLQVPASAIKEGYTDAIIVAFKAQKSTFDNTTGKTETVVKNTGTGSTTTVAVADELVNDINGTSGKAKAGKISNDSGKDIATFSYVSTGKTVTPTQIKAASDALSKLVVGKSTDKATDKAVEEIIKDVPGAVTYTFGSTTSISDFGFKVELRLNDLPASLGSNPTLFHMVNGKAVNMGKVNISGGSAVFTITGFSDYFLVKGVDELSAGEGATDSASDVVAETTTAAPAETVATTVAATTAAVIETVAPVVATTTAAAANPTTGNAPIALAVIPVAIAAAAVVAKKIVK